MTFQQFLERWNGKYIDYDGVYGPQCVDLARQYILEVLGFPNSSIKPVVGAKDMYEKYDTLVDKTYYDRIPNTPTGVPQEGDIIIWGNSTYGHVAIFVEGDTNSFRSFDQNYPTGSASHIQNHINYANVLGWLHPKQDSAQVECQAELDEVRKERDRNWDYFTDLCDIMKIQHSFDIAKAELEKLIKLEDVLRSKEKSLEEANAQIRGLEQALNDLRVKHEELKTDNAILTNQFTAQAQMIEEQGDKILDLSKTLDELKEQGVQEKSGVTLIKEGLYKLFGWR